MPERHPGTITYERLFEPTSSSTWADLETELSKRVEQARTIASKADAKAVSDRDATVAAIVAQTRFPPVNVDFDAASFGGVEEIQLADGGRALETKITIPFSGNQQLLAHRPPSLPPGVKQPAGLVVNSRAIEMKLRADPDGLTADEVRTWRSERMEALRAVIDIINERVAKHEAELPAVINAELDKRADQVARLSALNDALED